MTGHQRNFLDIIHFWPHTLSVDRPWLIKLKILDSAWRRRLYTGYWNKYNFTAWSHLRGPYFFVPLVFSIYGKNSNSSRLISQTFIKCKQKYLPFKKRLHYTCEICFLQFRSANHVINVVNKLIPHSRSFLLVSCPFPVREPAPTKRE